MYQILFNSQGCIDCPSKIIRKNSSYQQRSLTNSHRCTLTGTLNILPNAEGGCCFYVNQSRLVCDAACKLTGWPEVSDGYLTVETTGSKSPPGYLGLCPSSHLITSFSSCLYVTIHPAAITMVRLFNSPGCHSDPWGQHPSS